MLTHVYHTPWDPHPMVLLYTVNRTAESWLIKASKVFQVGRALGCILATLMVNNPMGINVDHVTSKDNKISDKISHIESELVLLSEMKKNLQGSSLSVILSTFSPMCRAKIAHYRDVVGKEVHWSFGSKQTHTCDTRKDHYLKFCQDMCQEDPVMKDKKQKY